MKKFFIGILGSVGLSFSIVQAAPVVTLDPSGSGIDSINVTVVGTTITIEEFWTSTAPSYLNFSGLESDVNYRIEKIIHNNTGQNWSSIANELLDPAGDGNDFNLDPIPYPAHVPDGFSTSNDSDGLSFAQGFGLERSSSIFSSTDVDELSDSRDFIDFFGGTLNDGETDNVMTFGLRDIDVASNQPFLLSQRPNEFSVAPIPVPAGVWLFGSGLIGLIGLSKRKLT